MAHHSIIFTCKDNITIPEKHQRSLSNFVCELNGIAGHGDVILHIKEEKVISFGLGEWVWDYTDDIDDLVEENKLTIEMIDAYRWLKENTDVSSDCWNACDNDYGPDCWDDIEWNLSGLKSRTKDTIAKLKNTLL